MQKYKRFVRLFLLLLMIGMAALLPVPILFYGKDDLPKKLIELVEQTEGVNEDDDIKELF